MYIYIYIKNCPMGLCKEINKDIHCSVICDHE